MREVISIHVYVLPCLCISAELAMREGGWRFYFPPKARVPLPSDRWTDPPPFFFANSGQAGVQIGNACWELYTLERKSLFSSQKRGMKEGGSLFPCPVGHTRRAPLLTYILLSLGPSSDGLSVHPSPSHLPVLQEN